MGEVEFFRDDIRLQVQAPRMVKATIEASSTLEPKSAYHSSYLFDQSVDYGWVEGVAGLGKGERITIAFDQPHEITGIQIYNGYQRSRDHFIKNARVAKLKISADGAGAVVVSVPDKMGPSSLKWKSSGKVKKLTLEIAAARPGKKYKDLGISELRFMDERGFFTVETDEGTELVSRLKKELKGKPLFSLLNRNLESYCRLYSESAEIAEDTKLGDFGLRKLKLRSNHRFVYYSQIAVGDEANIVLNPSRVSGCLIPKRQKDHGAK